MMGDVHPALTPDTSRQGQKQQLQRKEKSSQNGTPTSASVNAAGPKPYRKRPYAHACTACKARKIKCEESDTPPCRGCRSSSLICELPDRPSRRKRSRLSSSIPPVQPSADTKPPLPTPQVSRHHGHISHSSLEKRLRRIETALDLEPYTPSTASSNDDATPPLAAPPTEEEIIAPPRFQLGGQDHPVYHGETSMHEDIASPSKRVRASAAGLDVSSWTSEDLRGLTRLQHRYATADEGEAWMDAYFGWASTTYAVVNRTIFLRDMALDGPYFSHLLLLAFYLSGLRFSPNMSAQEREERSARYMKLAMNMITEEMSKPCSIPTAQALLTLAGRACSVGNQTQAWLFTGLAIRMIQDLGIHLAIDNPSLDAHLPQEVKELRTRLYWSAYCWDKTISLGMGREPAMTCRPDSFPEVELNDRDDDWEWTPFFPGGRILPNYPPTTSKTTFTLRYFSQLSMILESILVNMYSPQRPHARSVSFIRETDEQLIRWRATVPDILRLDRDNLPEFCPTTNVTCLNLLYSLVRILLYRPLLTIRNLPSAINSSFQICRSAAIDIHEILSLWGRTYGNVNMVYLIMYTTFVAAGVDVILLRIGDAQMKDEALKRIHLSLAILEQASDQGPGIRRGISIIASQLQAATFRPAGQSNASSSSSYPQPTPTPNLFPAESSMRHAPSRPTPSQNGTFNPTLLSRFDSAQSMALPVPNIDVGADPLGSVTETQPMLNDLLPTWFDNPSNQQTLAELLGESGVIGTDDPFAFLSGEGWDDSAF